MAATAKKIAPAIEPPSSYAPEVQAETAEALAVAGEAKRYLIESEEDALNAQNVLKEVKGKWKALEERRKRLIGPIDQLRKEVQDLFGPPLNYWKSAEAALKSALVGWEQLRAEREQAALVAAQEAQEAGADPEVVRELVVQSALPVERVAGVSTRKIWKARVTDFAKLSDKFKLPDESALNALARATKGSHAEPGVEFYEETVMSVRD